MAGEAPGRAARGEKARSVVSITRCEEYDPGVVDAALENCVGLLGGIENFVRRGQKVFLKPNLLLAAKPERAATTHPVFVASVIRLVQRTGAEVFFGDLPGGFHVGNTKTIYRVTGMDAAAKETGATLVRLEAHGFRKHKIPGAGVIEEVHVPKFLDGMDVIINLPKPKTHMQVKYTGAVKNLFGFVTTADRSFAHRTIKLKSFSAALAEIFSIFRPALTLMDAVVGMEGAGPSQGSPVRLGFVAGSADAVALDAVVTRLLGYGGSEIRTTRAAAELGLGEDRLSLIDTVGDSPSKFKKNIKKPPTHAVFTATAFGGVFTRLSDVRPLIDTGKCKKCNACVEVCPVDAIENGGDYVVDSDVCIRCFCCHEVCAYGAIGLKEAPLVKIIKKLRA